MGKGRSPRGGDVFADFDLFGIEEGGEVGDGGGDSFRCGEVVGRVWLSVDVVDGEDAAFAIHARVDAPDEAVSVQDGQNVVAVLAFGGGDVNLDTEAEIPHQLGAVAVADEVVEGGEQGGAGLPVASLNGG